MITRNGIEYRNLVEQVQKNKEDIAKHYDIEQTLADWGIKVIGRLDEWPEEPPAGSYVFGDAYAVGPEGGPFDFYIWTRRSGVGDEGYWLNYGPISIVGPQGPQGVPGPQGETGKSSRWFTGPSVPTGDIHEGDMWLKVNSDGSTDGFVYIYQNSNWALATSIKGPQGIPGSPGQPGQRGPQGPVGPQGPQGTTSPVIEILGTLSNIEQLYSIDPSTVAPNAAYLVTEDGVNFLYIIIQGEWANSGRWGGGTSVYNGETFLPSWNSATKLDLVNNVTENNQVYGKYADGNQTMYNIATSPTAFAIPLYNSNGTLTTNTPTLGNQTEVRPNALHQCSI